MGALLETLKARAPLSVGDYMALCNAHYYAIKDPFGAKGDFTTAPEISQIFGEVIGAFIAHMAGIEPFTLIEAGPGRGTLMADMLRVAKPEEIVLIETSPVLRRVQQKKLAGHKVKWSESISDSGSTTKNNILVFNEFFDALPIEQYVDGRQRQIVFKVDKAVFAPAAGSIGEDSPDRIAFMKAACALLKKGGLAVIIDYGPFTWGVGDSLQAVANHKFTDPLENPGEADLTSHVDFNALEIAAKEAGLHVHPLMTQREFLTRLGGGIRAQKLGKESDYDRLVNPDQMGELFKVLIVCHPDWQTHLREIL